MFLCMCLSVYKVHWQKCRDTISYGPITVNVMPHSHQANVDAIFLSNH